MEMKSVRFLIRTEPHSDYFHAYLVCGTKVIAKALGATPEKAIENLNGHTVAVSGIMTLGAGTELPADIVHMTITD